jgi:hypothetical protein
MFTVLMITQEEKVNENDLGIVNGDEVCGVEKLAKIPIFSKVASLAAAMVTVTSVEAQNRLAS